MNNEDQSNSNNNNKQGDENFETDSNWTDEASNQDDVVYLEDEELNKIEDEIFDEDEQKEEDKEESKGDNNSTNEEGIKHEDMSNKKFIYHKGIHVNRENLKVYSDSVYCLALSPTNEEIFASAGGDDIGVIWNVKEPQVPINILEGHKDTVEHVKYNFDGKLIATGSMDNTVIIWEAATGKKKHVLEGPTQEITFVEWHSKGNGILCGSNDNTLWIFDGSKGEFFNILQSHDKPVTCGRFTPDGKQVLSGSADGSIKVWNPRSAAVDHTIKGFGFHEDSIICMDVHSKNSILVTGSLDKTACISSFSNGKALGRTPEHGNAIESVAFHKNLEIFITGCLDNHVRIFDTNKYTLREKFEFESGITKILLHEAKNLIFASTIEGIIHVFDHRKNDSIKKITGNNSCINDFIVDKNEQVIAGGDDGKILLFDLKL